MTKDPLATYDYRESMGRASRWAALIILVSVLVGGSTWWFAHEVLGAAEQVDDGTERRPLIAMLLGLAAGIAFFLLGWLLLLAARILPPAPTSRPDHRTPDGGRADG